ncbi:MAG: glycosyltransferase family 2 protein [Candidatus Omnitrophica bacterium]|nr:glycosyltransferase family 2 protein [Candidatus Omnitrophota bacterium]
MKTVILIPAHNEAKAISDLVKRIAELGYDVIVIDDGSVDDTAILAKAQGALVISTYKKSGKGNALRLAFSKAIEQNYDAVITVDGDGQHSPEDLANFIEGYQKSHADIVNGDRMQNPIGMPLIRRWTNRFMSGIISLICHQKIADTQCGFRFITTNVLKVIELRCNDFEIETEILIRASKKGFRIISVPIQSIYRDEVSKIHPVRDTVRFICYISQEIFKS